MRKNRSILGSTFEQLERRVLLSTAQTNNTQVTVFDSNTGLIVGAVFNDLNANGKLDPTEVGIANRTVFIDLNNNNTLDANEMRFITDANGRYSLSNLPAGTYKVREVFVGGFTQTFPTNNFGLNVTLGVGQISRGNDFLVRPNVITTASISGFVFDDLNANGKLDADETGIAGRTVFIDLNNNNVLDSNETRVTTDVRGRYTLSNLAAGTYKVREVFISGWTQTLPTNNFGLNVILSTGQNATDQNFFTHPTPGGTGSISGTVFRDLNRNGIDDAGEAGLSGFVVYLDLNNDSILETNEQRVLTDSSGNYIFSNLAAGTYKIRLALSSLFAQTTPTNNFGNNATLAVGQAVTGKNFGADKLFSQRIAVPA